MSGDAADRGSLDRHARLAAAGLVLLIALAISWPAPVVVLNDLTLQASIAVDDDSFLGREAPSWDVVFWCIAGLYLLAMLHGRIETLSGSLRMLRNDLGRVGREVRGHWREYHWIAFVGVTLVAILVVGVVWFFFDAPLVGFVEGIQTEFTRSISRLLNRLGGGFNPVLVVLWFFVAGIVYSRPRWVELGICMVLAAAGGGLIAQIVKFSVGRSRPEVWLGPFHHAWPNATSFPSGHTLGAFAIGSVIGFGVRSWPVRVLAFSLAAGVGLSRVLAFRHWPSDVLASAILGTALGWIMVRPLADPHERSGAEPSVLEIGEADRHET